MGAALSNGQKRYLAQLARRAWERDAEADGLDEAGFRHEQVARAVGRLGLRCCSQDHYGAVKAHFLNLLGQPGRALEADLRGRPELNERRIILWKIKERCREYGIGIGVAEGICRQMTRGRSLEEADETRTLWNVFFKLRFYKPNAEKLKC
jgi:hypothetical protein